MVDDLTKVQNDFSDSTELDGVNDPRPAQELHVTTAAYTSSRTQTTVLMTYQKLGGAHSST